MSAAGMEECKVKVAFVGDANVGKTSLVSSYLFGKFSTEYEETIGVDFFSKSVFLEKLMVRMQIWDLSGHERFRELIPSYIRDAQALVVVYDVSNRESFAHTTAWVKTIREATSAKVIVLVGSKTDTTSRTVSAFEGESKAKELGCLFVEATPTSARTVTRVFLSIAEAVEDDRKKSDNGSSSSSSTTTTTTTTTTFGAIQLQPTARSQAHQPTTTSTEHWIDIPLDQPVNNRPNRPQDDCFSMVLNSIHATLKAVARALPW